MKKRIWIPAAVLTALVLPGFYAGLTVRHYEIQSEKISHPVRIAHLSDLHSCRYGNAQEKLLRAIHEEAPDVIVMTGDMFDDKRDDQETAYLVQGLSGRYPCYYVTGNHEYWAGKEKFSKKMEILKANGVRILHSETELLQINGESLQIAGLDDPDKSLDFHYRRGLSSFQGSLSKELSALDRALDPDTFALLLTHRPELFPLYRDTRFDLVLSGHAHGGQWRLPFLQNGVYAPHQGFFPRYSGGLYREKGTTMIASRGLARESTAVPRFYNPPELVIIDIK